MKVRWESPAIDDLRGIWEYIAQDSPSRATAMVSRLRLVALGLEEFSRLGRTGDRAGARELVVARTPYIIVYRIGGDEIEIVRVLHGAQRRPE